MEFQSQESGPSHRCKLTAAATTAVLNPPTVRYQGANLHSQDAADPVVPQWELGDFLNIPFALKQFLNIIN